VSDRVLQTSDLAENDRKGRIDDAYGVLAVWQVFGLNGHWDNASPMAGMNC